MAQSRAVPNTRTIFMDYTQFNAKCLKRSIEISAVQNCDVMNSLMPRCLFLIFYLRLGQKNLAVLAATLDQ